RRWISAYGDSCGMKLNKLWVCDERASPRRHSQPFASRLARVGRNGIESAKPACRKYDRGRAKKNEPCVMADAIARKQTDDAAIFHRKFDRVKAFKQGNRGGFQGTLGDRARDFGDR